MRKEVTSLLLRCCSVFDCYCYCLKSFISLFYFISNPIKPKKRSNAIIPLGHSLKNHFIQYYRINQQSAQNQNILYRIPRVKDRRCRFFFFFFCSSSVFNDSVGLISFINVIDKQRQYFFKSNFQVFGFCFFFITNYRNCKDSPSWICLI